MTGASWRHGPHHEAHTLITRGLPRSWARRIRKELGSNAVSAVGEPGSRIAPDGGPDPPAQAPRAIGTTAATRMAPRATRGRNDHRPSGPRRPAWSAARKDRRDSRATPQVSHPGGPPGPGGP